MENPKKKTLRLDKEELAFLHSLLVSPYAKEYRRKWYYSDALLLTIQKKVFHAYSRSEHEEETTY